MRALREALLNAVRHGAPPVSVYVEMGSEHVEAFVRDHGPGFDPEDVPKNRHGRLRVDPGSMSRHCRSAKVRRLEHGTEVSISLPLAAASASVDQPNMTTQTPCLPSPSVLCWSMMTACSGLVSRPSSTSSTVIVGEVVDVDSAITVVAQT